MKNQRPKNLNLFTIRFPLPAIISILHRVSGVVLFFLIPLSLWALNFSLTSQGFETIQDAMSSNGMKFIIWCCLSAFLYHFFAGIRHLLMDVHIGEELKSGRLSAMITIVIAVLSIILTGMWIW